MTPEQQTYYYHGYTTDGYRFTIAGQYRELGYEFSDKVTKPEIDVIILGISICSNNDNFNKKLGRIRAKGRMMSKGHYGSTHVSLYSETKPLNWFKDQESKVFVESVNFASSTTRNLLMEKFNLSRK
jgi:hypothetical protein